MTPKQKSKNGVGWRNVAALAVFAISLTAMAGDVLRFPPLKGLGFATTIAPCPKVFCDVQGLEGFVSTFVLRFETNGQIAELNLTPELYSRLKGPYNRRNVYGAALSFGPRLPEQLWRGVFQYGLGSNGPLRREFGIHPDATNLVVIIETKTQGRNDRWELRQP